MNEIHKFTQFVKRLQSSHAGSTLLSVVSFFALLYAASRFFFQLQFALNRVWGVPPRQRGQARALVPHRMLSFLMVLVLGLILVALACMNLIGTWLGSTMGIEAYDSRLGVPAFALVATGPAASLPARRVFLLVAMGGIEPPNLRRIRSENIVT